MMGTADGFGQLQRAFGNATLFPRFPCCGRYVAGKDESPRQSNRNCLVNEQHCVLSALQVPLEMRYALDVNSTLVLNVHEKLTRLTQLADGRITTTRQMYRRGPHIVNPPPCVVHFPGRCAHVPRPRATLDAAWHSHATRGVSLLRSKAKEAYWHAKLPNTTWIIENHTRLP